MAVRVASRIYALAAFCAVSNTSRAEVSRLHAPYLEAEVHPSCIHSLEHFFGRSGVALRNSELFERFRPACTRDCKGFHVEIQDLTQLLRDFIGAAIQPSSTTRCPDQAGPVKRVAISAPMSFVATMVDFRFVGL